MNIKLNKYFVRLTETNCVLENEGSNDDVVEVRIFDVPEDDDYEIDFDEPIKTIYLHVNDKAIINLKGQEQAYVRMNVGLTGVLNCSVLEYEVEVPANVYTKEDVNDLLALKADKGELKSTSIMMKDGVTTVEKSLQDRITQESKTAQQITSVAQGLQDATRRLSTAEGELDTFEVSVEAITKEFERFANVPTDIQLLKANFASLSETVSELETDLTSYKSSLSALLDMYTKLESRVQALENPRP